MSKTGFRNALAKETADSSLCIIKPSVTTDCGHLRVEI